MKVEVVDATLDQVYSVLDDIRPADMAEWYAGSGLWFEKAVAEAFEGNEYRKAALLGGLPLCFWGVGTDGYVWLFATETAEKHALSLHRVLKPELNKLFEVSPRLLALADSRNTVHHQWLEWLGFSFQEEVPSGPLGMDFKLYTKEA
ncbi:hypothetical protein H7H48_15850 [Nitratireductor sp. B36]|uniref:hypothetical protein n=1 Tax=Nitratireductor sp. B36 TaxID=2762059 RepID=UPI001E473EEF|nr:hypothetical protein [Nitratireductor sp. B36]MCC5780535.1 hypothetical protein [Nitratireductor sp. B36]